MKRLPKMDHEERANRFLDAMSALRDMLAHSQPGFEVDGCELSQLLSVLNDEARLVVVPCRIAINDDGEDSS